MYGNLWKIKNLSTGEVTICEADQVLEVLVEYTEPWEAVDKHVSKEIHAACKRISEKCLSGFKDFDFGSICSWLNIRLERMPEYMTDEDLYEFLFE